MPTASSTSALSAQSASGNSLVRGIGVTVTAVMAGVSLYYGADRAGIN
jgi:hypothetical protein